MRQYFTLQKPRLIIAAWGDYGDVLIHGLVLSRPGAAELGIGRAGTFVPPIFFPGPFRDVVVTESTRKSLESSGLRGIGWFREVIVEKAVASEWAQWDRTKELEGWQLPFEGEPEEYILHPPHEIAIAAEIGALWSWHPDQCGKVIREPGAFRLEDISKALDVFRLHDTGWTNIFVTEKGRDILSQIMGKWAGFEEVKDPISH